ncbi:histidine phosphatase family protein [Streptomyces sp. NBC_01017]|uniref:histidine phosphatase family protein n=1 Tax=Streptomyces sp. NBC_01017 TaxID=2903721 RepID=UPI00386C053E|nr:histidine phosphatase family protein [Streptomyces sp. NBC_01017]
MTVRLTLLCAAAPVERDVRFGDVPLDERALRQAKAAAGALPSVGTLLTAPSQRCTQTAQALGWDVVTAEPALRDIDMGSWRGRTLSEVAASDGAGLATWMVDPGAAPHLGESVAEACLRVAAWLDALPADAGRILAVVEQAVARAAVVHVLDAPQRSFWNVDVPPLSTVQLTGRNGRWNLRMGGVSDAPVGGDG